MAREGVYNDRVKDIMGGRRPVAASEIYAEKQADENLAVTRISVEQLNEHTFEYQKAMLKSNFKQEDYLKKIEKHLKPSFLAELIKIANHIKEGYNLFQELKGMFSGQGHGGRSRNLEGTCCCDSFGGDGSYGGRRGRNRRHRGGSSGRGGFGRAGGGLGGIFDEINEYREHGTGAGRGTGTRGRTGGRFTLAGGLSADAFLSSSKKMAKEWYRATSDVMKGVFGSNKTEMQRSAAAIRRTAIREGGRFAKAGSEATKSVIGSAAGGIKKSVLGVMGLVGKFAGSVFDAYNFIDGAMNADQYTGRKDLNSIDRVNAGVYNLMDGTLLGIPSMITQKMAGKDFMQYGIDSDKDTNSRIVTLSKLLSDPAGSWEQLKSNYGFGSKPSASAATQQFLDYHAKAAADAQINTLHGSLTPNFTPMDQLSGTGETGKSDRVTQGFQSVVTAIDKSTDKQIDSDKKISDDVEKRRKALFESMRKYINKHDVQPTAADHQFSEPTGNKFTGPGDYQGLTGDSARIANPRTGKSDYQAAQDATVANQNNANQLFTRDSLGGGKWGEHGLQMGVLPAGFSGKAGNYTSMSTRSVGLGGGGKRPTSSELIDHMISEGASPALARAIVGNMGVESYNKNTRTQFDPTVTGDNGQALGLMQWHPDRQAKLFAFAKERGLDPMSREAQARFAVAETVAGGKYADSGSVAARKKIESGNGSLADNVGIFQNLAERPKYPGDSIAQRIAVATAADRNYSPLGSGRTFDQLAGDLTKRQGGINLPQLASGGKGDLPIARDMTKEAGFGYKFGKLDSVNGLIVHHTGSRGSPESIIKTFQERNFPAQYIMDRDGNVIRALPEGARGQHMRRGQGPGEGLSNANMEGIEVIAKDNNDWTDAQKQAMAKFTMAHSKKFGYDPMKEVFGHGEVNPHKRADEGMFFVDWFRKNYTQIAQDYNKANNIATITPSMVKTASMFPDMGAGLVPKGPASKLPDDPTMGSGKGSRYGTPSAARFGYDGSGPDPDPARFGYSSMGSFSGKVQKPDTAALDKLPVASMFDNMGQSINPDTAVASPTPQKTPQIPQPGSIPNNADITELMPLLISESTMK